MKTGFLLISGVKDRHEDPCDVHVIIYLNGHGLFLTGWILLQQRSNAIDTEVKYNVSWVHFYSLFLPLWVFVSNVLELLSSGRMFDRKWNWPQSLAGFRQPFPVPAHAKPCQLTARPRPPWEKQSSTSSGEMSTGPSLPMLWSQKKTQKNWLLTHMHIRRVDASNVRQKLIWKPAMHWGQKVQKVQEGSSTERLKRCRTERG